MTTPAMRGTAAAMKAWQSVFTAPIMRSVAYVATSVARFICLEVVEGCSAAARHRPVVAVIRVITVVDVAVEAVVTVKPRAGSNENSAIKPIRPVVAIR
jgi:hypothetical protein